MQGQRGSQLKYVASLIGEWQTAGHPKRTKVFDFLATELRPSHLHEPTTDSWEFMQNQCFIIIMYYDIAYSIFKKLR